MGNTKSNRLQAVIFDLDGVITDTAEYHFQAWQAIATDLGLPFTREFNENLKGVSRLDSLKLLLSQGDRDLTYTEEELDVIAARKNGLYTQLIHQLTPADILPGISELLGDLHSNGIQTAIASASKNAFTVIRLLGMEESFDYIVDAGTLKRNKPDPEVFLRAAQALNVLPENCIGVEDAATGVHAIKAAGMYAIAVGLEETFPHADVVVPDTSQLKNVSMISQFNN